MRTFLLLFIVLVSCNVNIDKRVVEEHTVEVPRTRTSIDSNQLRKYAYPVTIRLKDGTVATATGFFIKLNGQGYFVTARHCFFNVDTEKLLPIRLINIHLNPRIWEDLGWELKADELKITPVVLNGEYADIAFFPVSTQTNKSINFINVDRIVTDDHKRKGLKVSIPGYPFGFLEIIHTSIRDYQGTNFHLITDDGSRKGASGAPVITISNNGEVVLLGVYNGVDSENQGVATKIGVLRRYLGF